MGWQSGVKTGAASSDLDLIKIGQARNKIMDIKLNQARSLFFPFFCRSFRWFSCPNFAVTYARSSVTSVVSSRYPVGLGFALVSERSYNSGRACISVAVGQ